MGLISNADFIHATDELGRMYTDTQPGLDTANARAKALDAYLLATAFASDPDQFTDWHSVVKGLYAANTVSVGGTFTGAFGTGGFGISSSLVNAGRGLFSRSFDSAAMFANLEAINTLIRRYNDTGDASVIDITSYAAHYNALTPYSVLFSPDFAAARYLAYTQGNQLDPSLVFAPAGINMGTYTVGSSFTANTHPFPTANGYTDPAATTDSNGFALYAGGMPMAQGFAPVKTVRARVTTDINGTLTLIVTANNQDGTPKTWKAILDNLATGATVNLSTSSPATATSSDRFGGNVTAVTVNGSPTATAGELIFETVAER